ncbi:UNC93-like protein 3 [Coffea eugenioides]|uniref:UNC93-like protein 3 n=1 Tax=Coffea eugenioides TaxID=49369 RepID=UPI000F5C3073|nr:UNC93-like protein 3 [Coffea arabica]XP_027070796.1 UNC93-like protein 3 [Coffea arabica]XP_027070818.1 UNC93-like protein 3 [Coffea arabica]XP_027070819.1 UNC93-like protein 3 [Coffea arabica]XP_027070820.1 UNC93-like protein 3 [Coffea arabica]XP_027176197.1 UNC93-like protein 3 [Coffea eugenioides]XP_027176198.1 UNC93-like protein 3 [Coffea eugenioides]XP_027176199.1 UNC93-like protein 3 [Coffea eugenioides]
MAMDEETPLVVDHVNLSTQKNPTIVNYKRDVHILSWAFLLIFLAYGAAQNLESTINTEGDLGTISLGILYLSFTFFSVIASVVVGNLGSKNTLILGTTGYWLFIAANLKPTWYTMVPASLYLGFTASIIWVAQGTYLTSTARGHALDNDLPEGTVIGKFNGEFWGMFASHQFVGNLITLALLRGGKGGSTTSTTSLFIVFLCIMTIGTILMCFLSNRSATEKEEEQDSSVSFCYSVVSLFKAVLALLLDIRILLVIPLIAYSGFQQSFVWAAFTKHVVQPTLGERGVGGVMAVYGVFDAVCSLAAGQLTSGLSTITVIVLSGAFIQTIAFLLLFVHYSMLHGVVGLLYPFLIAALLGVGDGVLNTQLSAFLGIIFKHNLEGAFAQLKFWQSLSIAILFFMSPHIALHIIVVIILVILCFSVAAFLFLILKVERAFSFRTAA